MPIIGVLASSDRNAPDAPTIGTATNVGTGRAFNNGRADVTFTAPVYTGGSPITSYTVTSSPGGFTGTGAASPISVTGLQSGVAYTFTVTATNAVGTSAASAVSNSITATTVPQAPTIGTATAGSGQATVTFTANATGGSAITGFTATSSPGSITGTGASSPITVTGLTNGTAYTFTVTATNANGTSAPSAASNSVTPIVPGVYDSIASVAIQSVNSVTISNIPTTYKHLVLRYATQAPSGVSTIDMRFNGNATANYCANVTQLLNDGTRTSFRESAQNQLKVGRLLTLDSVNMTGVITTLPYYSNTSNNAMKTHLTYSGVRVTGGTTGGIMFTGGALDSGSAVTSVTIFSANSAQFNGNGRICLYGIG